MNLHVPAKSLHVAGIGNALVDILVHTDEAVIEELGLVKGTMHLVDADRQQQVLKATHAADKTIELGGSTLNIIRTLAGLGAKTSYAGMVSNDDFGERVQARMKELGIQSRLGKNEEPTGSCVVLVTPDGERTLNTHLGASRLYSPDDVPHDDIRRAQVLHFCGYQWDTEGQKQGIAAAMKSAKQAGTKISFDVADPFAVERNREAFIEVIEESDIVFANQQEAHMLFDASPEETASRIAATGAIACIKLGAQGALIRSSSEKTTIAAEPTEVVDTTGAGDMFAAGFLFGYCHNRPLEVAGKMATIAAGDVISRMGAAVSEPALEKIAKLLS